MTRSEAQSARQTIPFTIDQLSEMADMYRNVRSLRKVGEKFGINRNAVRTRLIAQGVEIMPFSRQPILNRQQISEAMSLLDSGSTPLEVAFKYGVHDSTIRKYAIKYG